jgi:hypothetical protein
LSDFEWDVLIEQIVDGGHAKGVRREVDGELRHLEPPLHHPADVGAGHRVGREILRLADGGTEERPAGGASGLDVSEQLTFEVVSDLPGELGGLACKLDDPGGMAGGDLVPGCGEAGPNLFQAEDDVA